MFTKKTPNPSSHTTVSSPRPKSSEPLFRHYPFALRLKARSDFVRGEGTLEKIARRYSVNEQTLRQWSSQEKWSKHRKLFVQKKIQADDPPEIPIPYTPQIPSPSNSSNSLQSQILKIETHLAQIDEAITEARTGRELRDLMMARKLAADQWANYTGFPKPGTRKQGKKSGGQSAPVFEPLDPGIQAPEEETTTTGSGAETVP